MSNSTLEERKDLDHDEEIDGFHETSDPPKKILPVTEDNAEAITSELALSPQIKIMDSILSQPSPQAPLTPSIERHDITIRQRDFYKHYISTNAPSMHLQWAFRTAKRSLGFGLFYLYDGQVRAETVRHLLGEMREKVKIEPSAIEGSALRSILSRDSSSSNLAAYAGTGHASTNDGSGGMGNALGAEFRNGTLPAMSTLSRTLSELSLGDNPSTAILEETPLTIGEMLEVLPIERYQSGERLIKGALLVLLPGSYVLYFDNTTSLQTAKHLSFAVGIQQGPPPETTSPNNLDLPLSDLGLDQSKELRCVGWLLKKRHRRLPGWSKRWFQLDRHGILAYWEHPPPPIAIEQHHQIHESSSLTSALLTTTNGIIGEAFRPRGILKLADATISKVPSRRLITIDSSTDTWHLRAASDADYRQWDEALHGHDHDRQQGVSEESLPDIIASMPIEAMLEKTEKAISNISSADDLQAAQKALKVVYARICQERAIHGQHPDILAREGLQKREGGTRDTTAQDMDLFYDVEEIILSDISASEYAESEHEEFMPTLERDTSYAALPDELSMINAIHALPSLQPPMLIPDKEMMQETMVMERAPLIGPIPWPLPGQRTRLPACAPASPDISIAGILRKNIGKDWTSLTLPVAINEPLGALQRLAEDLEYSELLDRVSSRELEGDSLERLVLVTAFAVSSYASARTRVERKPFNPLLGETYELELPERGFRFVAEKVSHRPLIVASYAANIGPNPFDGRHPDGEVNQEKIVSLGDRWSLTQDQCIKSKFWGKSMEYIPAGKISLNLPRTNDTFTWTRVVSCVRNVLSSSGKWLEFYGETTIRNGANGDMARLSFKASGLFGSAAGAANEVVAHLQSGDGRRRIVLRGRWDRGLWREGTGSTCTFEDPSLLVWHANPLPPNYADYYGFTHMAMLLNDLHPLSQHPKTDTRHRPDQRLLENGALEDAENAKQHLEQRQRDTRALMGTSGQPWIPRWFRRLGNDSVEDSSWEYSGEYWRRRDEEGVEEFDRKLSDLW